MKIKATELQRTFTLELSELEARVLYTVMGNIVGDCASSPREITDRFYDQLETIFGDKDSRELLSEYYSNFNESGSIRLSGNAKF